MASCHSSLFAVSICFRRISTLLVRVFLLGRVGAQDRREEVRALVELRDSQLTGSWDDDLTSRFDGYWSSWNETDENSCAWAGVVCSTNFTVVELDFSGWQLTPEYIQPLARLRDLRHLDISSSNLPLIPEDIGTLTQLIRLDMSSNNLIYRIPASISNCTSLQYISLEQNQLYGEIPRFRGLVNLKVLNLANNQLTGQFPDDLLELRNLVNIDLSQNKLDGSIPSLSKLTKLRVLSLDDNNFTKFEESWLPAPNLEFLSVSGNLLDGMIPPGLANMSTSIVSLNMSRNHFSSVPFGFSQLFLDSPSDVWLDLSQNQLSGNTLHLILPDATSNGYIHINMSHNSLTGNIPLDSAKVHHYFALDLSYNQLNGPIPNFSNNDTFFFSLQLQHNSISGDIVDVLSAPSYRIGLLSELRLENNLLSGDLSRMAFVNCSVYEFNSVDLSNNNLQMSTMKTNADPLRAVLECFTGGSQLQEFRMAGNNFSGIALPSYFDLNEEARQNLAVLDVSNNHLKGELFDDNFLGTLSTLQYLNLSNNHLIGLIPGNIVNLPNLTIFDVSNNSLRGQVPTILPSNGLYNPSFFAGNDALCGDPLPPCNQDSLRQGEPWGAILIIIGSLIIALGSCLVATWRWRVYHSKHQQDADLIKTLMDEKLATLMALRDLKKATNNFAKTAQIGEGGFGAVYMGKLGDGRRVAIKRSKREGSEKDKEQFLNEVRILSQINHRHLVKLLGCCMENQIALLVFEFVPNGTIQEHLQGKFLDVCLSWDKRLNVAIQTAEALDYLHSGATFPIYHRDVKSANILLNEHLHAKVADFGISRLVPIEVTHVSTIVVQGTIGYIDPEYYTSYQLNDKSDVYSFGVVLLELISAKPAIDFLRGGDETSLVIFAKPHIQSGDLQQLIDGTLLETYNDPTGNGKESLLNVGQLALKCLAMESKVRPSMKQVLKELQNLRIELNGQSKDLGSTIENHNVDSQNGHIVSFPNNFTSGSSSLILQNGGSDIEMSKSSCL